MPHNFNELIEQSILHLRGKKVEIFPDFLTGGMADFSNYNDGLRGGKVRVRAKIKKLDNKTFKMVMNPFIGQFENATKKLYNNFIKFCNDDELTTCFFSFPEQHINLDLE